MYIIRYNKHMARMDQNGHVGMFNDVDPPEFWPPWMASWRRMGWCPSDPERPCTAGRLRRKTSLTWRKKWGESIWICDICGIWKLFVHKKIIIDGSFLLLSSTSYALREQTGRSTTSVESRAAIAWLWLSACQLHKTMGTKSWEGTVVFYTLW